MTDKLRNYNCVHHEVIPETIHENERYAINRAEQTHESTRVRERGNAEIQISWASSAIRDRAFCCIQFLQPWKASCKG